MKQDIILIGPMTVGKSTIGALLAETLGLPQRPMDDLRWDYYAEIGYDRDVELQVREEEGTMAVMRYWKPFEAHAVERLLSDFENCVFDFGAGHSIFDEGDLFDRVARVLEPYANIILLIPSPDLNESVTILQKRFQELHEWDGIMEDGNNIHEYFVKHPSHAKLAKHVVYTKDKMPEETCAEILALVQSNEE